MCCDNNCWHVAPLGMINIIGREESALNYKYLAFFGKWTEKARTKVNSDFLSFPTKYSFLLCYCSILQIKYNEK